MSDVETKPTHRCPKCGGTSEVSALDEVHRVAQAAPWAGILAQPLAGSLKQVPCPVCTQYGPFGLVPEVVAIEVALCDEVGVAERTMRHANNRAHATVEWLLNDLKVDCEHCGGTGMWTNPRNAYDKRECYQCGGKGRLV